MHCGDDGRIEPVLTLSPIKILIVVVVALFLVGPDKLPQVSRQIGGAWNAFRQFTKRIEDDVRSSMPDLPSTGDIARFARSPVALLDSLAKMSDEELKPDPGLAPEAPNDELAKDPASPSAPSGSTPPQREDGPQQTEIPPGDPSLN
jgi:TatA/E family protein of Tat protein translocase